MVEASSSDATVLKSGDGDGSFTCPRCGSAVEEDLYGPCGSCRLELRARFAGGARRVEVGDYEPKMNVTPNAVALKE